MRLLCRQVADDDFSAVRAARAAYFMKLGVEQVFQSIATAPNSGVMELNLERLEFKKQGGHESVLCAA
jgi:hypothetical protein